MFATPLLLLILVMQIAVPSRTDVPEYQKLRSMVHEIVGRINGAFGTLTYVPIHHLDRQLSFHELCALYAVTGMGWVRWFRGSGLDSGYSLGASLLLLSCTAGFCPTGWQAVLCVSSKLHSMVHEIVGRVTGAFGP
eukprot:GHUV01023873.1.p1 GENE.GHUV01023873.1~~GHUV01023873.1.p1  ORF type:complete len:136 (+),score=25.55 GHUV01023873.1:1093-1500(+)